VADLIRTLESDLFGAYEWAADLYGDLVAVDEAPDRLAVYRGLLRCYEGLEGRSGEAMEAADGLVLADDDLDDTERATIAPLDAARERLFQEPDVAHADAFLRAFEPLWQGQAHKQALTSDAMLAALAHSNIIAATRNKTISPDEARAHHAKAAQLYEELYAMLSFRVGAGGTDWRETMQSCIYRASVAWRFAGEDAKSKRAQEIAGPPPDAATLTGRGLKG
jgi:hypothetical protein